jgi:hypothetical protein
MMFDFFSVFSPIHLFSHLYIIMENFYNWFQNIALCSLPISPRQACTYNFLTRKDGNRQAKRKREEKTPQARGTGRHAKALAQETEEQQN